MGWTVFGKISREGDFVRHELRDPIAMECFRWIADSVSQQPGWVRAIPPQGVRFVFASPTARDRVLVGTLVHSRDRVGREFPLVALHASSGSEVARAFPAIPLAWSASLGAVRRALLELGPRESIASIAAALAEIAPPSSTELRDAHGRASQALQLAASDDFHDRVFAGDAATCASAPHYAYHTVRVAAAQAFRAQGPAIVCPVAVASDVVAWLELLRRLVPAIDRPLGSVWTVGVDARLVACLADMPTAALHAVVGCASESARLWPLSTPSDAARAKARALIEPLLPPATAPLASVIDALAQRSH